MNDPYGVIVSDLEQLDGAKHAELSDGVKNIIKRARQLYEVKWTALSEIESYPGSGQNLYFREGVEYQGIPYGQPVHKGSYVGFDSTIEDFVDVTSDAQSDMYTTYGENTWYYDEYGDIDRIEHRKTHILNAGETAELHLSSGENEGYDYTGKYYKYLAWREVIYIYEGYNMFVDSSYFEQPN